MKSTLWYSKEMNLWRWIVCKDDMPIIKQETGQNSSLDEVLLEIKIVLEKFKS